MQWASQHGFAAVRVSCVGSEAFALQLALLYSVSEIEKQWVGPAYRFPATIHAPADVC